MSDDTLPEQTTTTSTTTPAPATTTTTTAAPEAFTRPEALWFTAEKRPDGQPAEHLAGYGIPARHIRKGDPAWRHLTDDLVKLALASGLYRRTRPDKATDPWNDEPAEGAAQQ